MNTDESENLQPETSNMQLVYAYTRAQAVADGVQVEVTKTAQTTFREANSPAWETNLWRARVANAGIRFPVFLTRTVWDAYVEVPPGVTGQDETGRLWDIIWMTRFAILRAKPGVDRVPVALYVRNEPDACPVGCAKHYPTGAKLVKLIAQAGPLDIDDPSPAITIMMPDED